MGRLESTLRDQRIDAARLGERSTMVLTLAGWVVNLGIVTFAFLLVSRETAQRNRLRFSLRESELQYRTVVESLHEGVVVHSADGSIRAFNQRARRKSSASRRTIFKV